MFRVTGAAIGSPKITEAHASSVVAVSQAKAPVPPTRDTVCAVIVTYHPEPDFFKNMEALTSQVDHTVVVDNGSSNDIVVRLQHLSSQRSIHLILNHRNEGIADALNAGARWAIARGYEWILTLDQDTLVKPSMIAAFSEVYSWWPFPDRLAVIGSNFHDKKTGKLLWDFSRVNAPAVEIPAVLTSGSLVSAKIFQTIGGFRSDFFIDCVDFEYCLRARAYGFGIFLAAESTMEHGIGHLTQHRLLWKIVSTSNHPPLRQYFLARNSLILVREYLGREPRWILKFFWAWIKSIVRIMLLEKNRLLKAKNIVRGCSDGLMGRTHWRPT